MTAFGYASARKWYKLYPVLPHRVLEWLELFERMVIKLFSAASYAIGSCPHSFQSGSSVNRERASYQRQTGVCVCVDTESEPPEVQCCTARAGP